MDKDTKKLLQIVSIAAIATAVPVAIAAAFLVNSLESSGMPGNWHGWGDWKACAEIASVQPKEAVETAARDLNISSSVLRWKYVEFGPVYVVPLGEVYNLECSGGITVGSERTPWEHPTFSQPSYAWEITIGTPNTGCMPSIVYIKWNVTDSLHHIRGC